MGFCRFLLCSVQFSSASLFLAACNLCPHRVGLGLLLLQLLLLGQRALIVIAVVVLLAFGCDRQQAWSDVVRRVVALCVKGVRTFLVDDVLLRLVSTVAGALDRLCGGDTVRECVSVGGLAGLAREYHRALALQDFGEGTHGTLLSRFLLEFC